MAIPRYTYDDLIQPTSAITDAIAQLTQMNSELEKTMGVLSKSAAQVEANVRKATSATSEGREGIHLAAEAADELDKQQTKTIRNYARQGQEIQHLKNLQKEHTQITRLQTQINESAEGSYNKLSATYSLMKLKLNAMSKAQRENTVEGKRMVQQSKEIYMEMSRLQQATGKHTLSVGNYAKATYGLNTAFNQVTRELPVLGMNLNTFFLAISNNIPMLVDELARLKKTTKELTDQGKQVPKMGKQIVKAILSWQTALSIGVALLTIYGKEMVEFIGSLVKGTKAIDEQAVAQDILNKVRLEGSVKAETEMIKLEKLRDLTTDETAAMEDRIEAAEHLQGLWPETFENMSQEEILAGKNADAYIKLAEAILKKAIAEEAQEMVGEKARKLLEAMEKYADKTAKAGNRIATFGGVFGMIMGSFARGGANKQLNDIVELNAEMKALIESIDILSLLDTPGGAGGAVSKTVDHLLRLQQQLRESGIAMMDEGLLKTQAGIEEKYVQKREGLLAKTGLSPEAKEVRDQLLISLEKEKNVELLKAFRDYMEKVGKEQQKQIDEAIKLNEQQYKEALKVADQMYDLRMNEIDNVEGTEAEKTKLRLQAEIDRWYQILDINDKMQGDLSALEIASIEERIEYLKGQKDNVEKEGLDLYSLLGLELDDDQKKALGEAFKQTIDYLDEYLDKRLEIKDKLIDAAREEVDAAKSALDAEREARANGYAYNVSDAQRRLKLAKETEQKALAEKAKLQKKQEALQAIEQAGNLITATSEIWAAFGGFPPAAIAATALLWGSFAAAKVQAFKATEPVTYGEGGYEDLDYGGSHASGHDIDLGTTRTGRRRRAERGEMLAVIKRSSVKKYRSALPSIIDSLNSGTFEQKYLNAYNLGGIALGAMQSAANLSALEGDVSAIRKQGERMFFTDGKGRTIEQYKNLTRIHNVN